MNKPIAARERYLDIAARRFAEAGFHGVSLSDLAEDAGVTKQALLHHFRTKERLYAEVLTRLSERLSADVEGLEAPTAEERLVAYFEAYLAAVKERPDDARLVLRALLDSKAEARFWPMKSYLDKLVALALETPRWRDSSAEETLASLYHLIGAMQFFSISPATLSGMYGDAAAETITAQFTVNFRAAVQDFLKPA